MSEIVSRFSGKVSAHVCRGGCGLAVEHQLMILIAELLYRALALDTSACIL